MRSTVTLRRTESSAMPLPCQPTAVSQHPGFGGPVRLRIGDIPFPGVPLWPRTANCGRLTARLGRGLSFRRGWHYHFRPSSRSPDHHGEEGATVMKRRLMQALGTAAVGITLTATAVAGTAAAAPVRHSFVTAPFDGRLYGVAATSPRNAWAVGL